jgi:hypothetical protein
MIDKVMFYVFDDLLLNLPHYFRLVTRLAINTTSATTRMAMNIPRPRPALKMPSNNAQEVMVKENRRSKEKGMILFFNL